MKIVNVSLIKFFEFITKRPFRLDGPIDPKD